MTVKYLQILAAEHEEKLHALRTVIKLLNKDSKIKAVKSSIEAIKVVEGKKKNKHWTQTAKGRAIQRAHMKDKWKRLKSGKK